MSWPLKVPLICKLESNNSVSPAMFLFFSLYELVWGLVPICMSPKAWDRHIATWREKHLGQIEFVVRKMNLSTLSFPVLLCAGIKREASSCLSRNSPVYEIFRSGAGFALVAVTANVSKFSVPLCLLVFLSGGTYSDHIQQHFSNSIS